MRPVLLLLSTASLVVLSALASGTAVAAPGAETDSETPAALVLAHNDDLTFVRERGTDLFERHQAVLIALEAARELSVEDMAPLGWLTVREAGSLRVRFVGGCPEGEACALLDVIINEEGLSAEAIYPPTPLPGQELLAWQAKQQVFAAQKAVCDVPYNAIALPPENTADEWVVYLIPEPEEADVIAVGGHMRVFLDATAGKILRTEDFSKTCLLVKRKSEQMQLAVSYEWALLPAEIHVLASLLRGISLYISTRSGIFRVNGNEIQRLGDARPGG